MRIVMVWALAGGLACGQANAQRPADAANGQKKGPPIPAGTGGPGGTNRAEQMQKFLAIGDAPDLAAVARGKGLFVGNCGFCHGATARGGESGPDLTRSVLVLHDNGGDQIGPVVHNGRTAKGMPAFASFTQAQIGDIAAYLKAMYQSAANRGSYQIQNLNTGNAEEGKTYFAAHCTSCHSATGDLAGIAKKYPDEEALQSRFLYPRPRRESGAEVPSKATPKVTVTTANGHTVTGTLAHIDDFNVALIDANGVYQSWPLGDDSKDMKVAVDDPLAGHLELLKQYSNADMHNILAYLETLK